MKQVDRLTNKQAIEAAQFVVGKWMQRSGPEALSIWQQIEHAEAGGDPLEPWLLDTNADTEQAAAASRKVLNAFLESSELQATDFPNWAREGIADAVQSHGQVFEPVSVAVAGYLAIALVLASRVKKVKKDRIEFYEGLPKGLERIIKLLSGLEP
jgi:hypothetical protein